MKKCIIITEKFNFGPTGIVVKQIADGFYKNHVIPLIIAFDINDKSIDHSYLEIPGKNFFWHSKYSTQIEKFRLILSKNCKDYFYYVKDLRCSIDFCMQKHEDDKLQFVMVVSSGNIPIRLMRLGQKLSKKFNIPYLLHATDPLPSPKEWGEKEIYRKAVIKAISPFYKKADLISASNPVMLDYQLKSLGLIQKKSFVLYNPLSEWKELDEKKIVKNSFLYLGSVYGKRDPHVLIKTFLSLLEKVPDARLVFVGSRINLGNFEIPPKSRSNFVSIDWTEDVEKYIQEAEVLIDYNANIQGDVFLSSKLSKYIGYNRKILVICTKSSAPAFCFRNEENINITLSLYDQESIVEKCCQLLNLKPIEWEYRKRLVKNLQTENIINDLIQKLN